MTAKVRLCVRICLGASVLLAGTAAIAGVAVKENVSPGATTWPGTPIISTVANPSSATVVESFNGVGGNTNLSETFTITTTNYTLQSISIYAGTGSGTGPGTNLTLKLYDLGNQTAPNPGTYTADIIGGDLFGGGAGLSVAYTVQAAGVLEFDFDGADQVTLTNGHMYAFELTGVLNTTPVFWSRGVSDTYAGGAAYRNQGWINGSNARDFALAVYANASTSSNTPPPPTGPNGIVFHAFSQPDNGINQDGANPGAGLVLLGGLLCGTTINGGSHGAGTAFYMAPDASAFGVFRPFADVPDAARPQANFAVAGATLYGTSFAGGASGAGTIYSTQTNGVFSVIHSFATVQANNATNVGGGSPSSLPVWSGGLLFGTTTAGGSNANGTIFSVTTNGTGFSVLHDFSELDSVTGTNADGAAAWGGLVLSGGSLYGTASAGGAGGNGVVFSVTTNGANFTALHSFTAMDPEAATNADGAIPMAGLIEANGALYGTTTAGGPGGKGTVFSIGTNGLGFAVLHSFSPTDPQTDTNADGASPCGTLTLSGSVLYGTAPAGGAGGSGVVFSINTNGSQFNCLYSFTPVNAATGTNSDGAQPVSQPLLLGTSLYGTAFAGGPGASGTVFSLNLAPVPALITNIVINADGSVTLSFTGQPNSTNVVQASDDLTSPANWQNISTNMADANGEWQFTDSVSNNPGRFYRSYAR